MSTAAIQRIDKQLDSLPPDSLRARVLVSVRRFRASWVELGRLLTEVAYGGQYKEWGYDEFELYCASELGLKRPTVKKLMVSYNYMKTREPDRLEAFDRADETGEVPNIPDYQTVELLHKASENPQVDDETRQRFHRQAFDGEEDEGDLRRQLRQEMRGDSDDPEDGAAARRKEINDVLRTARALRRKLAFSRYVPEGLRDRLEQLLVELEALD